MRFLAGVLALLLVGCHNTQSFAVRMPKNSEPTACYQRCSKQRVVNADTEDYLQCLVQCPEMDVARGKCATVTSKCANETVESFNGRGTAVVVVLVVAAAAVGLGVPLVYASSPR